MLQAHMLKHTFTTQKIISHSDGLLLLFSADFRISAPQIAVFNRWVLSFRDTSFGGRITGTWIACGEEIENGAHYSPPAERKMLIMQPGRHSSYKHSAGCTSRTLRMNLRKNGANRTLIINNDNKETAMLGTSHILRILGMGAA